MQKAPFLLFFCTIVYIGFSCQKHVDPTDNPKTFSYDQPITNPPDEFVILFNFYSIGQKSCLVSFADSSEWFIEKKGDPRCTVKIEDEYQEYVIDSSFTLEAKPAFEYKISVTNVYITDAIDFFVSFTKKN